MTKQFVVMVLTTNSSGEVFEAEWTGYKHNAVELAKLEMNQITPSEKAFYGIIAAYVEER